MKLVLDTKPGSGYDDALAERYHFPDKNYLPLMTAAQGDWAVFRQPRAGGGHMGYLGVGKIARLAADPERMGHHYAFIEDFLPFDAVVPWRKDGRYWESALRERADTALIGAALRGASVRPLADADFAAIVLNGLSETLSDENRRRLGLVDDEIDAETQALIALPAQEQERRVVEFLVNRKIRDASFRRQVIDAYDGRCAVTRLRIINGGGRAEAQAAHIDAVKYGGPDVVTNGVALSATVHWLFDRHLISLDPDRRLLVAHNRVPADLRALFHEHEGRIHLPADPAQWPAERHMARHRARFGAA